MKRIITVALIALFGTITFNSAGQSSTRELNKADRAMLEHDFKKALKNYHKVLEHDTTAYVLRSLAQCYAYMQQHEISSDYFKKVLELPNSLPLDILEYAQSLKRIGHYEEALVWFDKYRKVYPLDIRTRNHMVNSYHYKQLALNEKNPQFFSLDINDDQSIMGFTRFEDGVIFSKVENNGSADFMDSPEYYLDIFEAKLDEKNELKKIRYLPFHLNTSLNDGPCSYNEATKTLAFSRNQRPQKTDVLELQLFFSVFDGDHWSEATEFEYNSGEYSLGHPSFSPDGQKLFFISNMPGGYGGTDIYYSEFKNGYWSKPRNLGPEVNTESDEMFPYAESGEVLYFSSEGHAGLGGMDMFKTYLFEEFWSKPENMGAPINSRANDFGFMNYSSRKAFFCSDRVGGKGSDDVYFIDIKATKKFFNIPSQLIDSENLTAVVVTNLKTGEVQNHDPILMDNLRLKVGELSYKVAWQYQGEPREIIISGEKDETGKPKVDYEGLDGLQPADFLTFEGEIGVEGNEVVSIDRKVWSFIKAPEVEDLTGYFVPDASANLYTKNNVIFLDKDGNAKDVIKPYSAPSDINKQVFYASAEGVDHDEMCEKLSHFCNAYSEESPDEVIIKCIEAENATSESIKDLGEQIEQYLVAENIPLSKISLLWVKDNDVSASNEAFEIYISSDSGFSLVE